MKLRDLLPGSVIEDVSGIKHTFVTMSTVHPIYPGLALVVWRRDSGEWFHDALSADLDVSQVGQLIVDDPSARRENLRKTLLHPSQVDRAAHPTSTGPRPSWMEGWRLAAEWLEEQGELHLAQTMRTRLPDRP